MTTVSGRCKMIPDEPTSTYGGPADPSTNPSPDPAFSDTNLNRATEPASGFDSKDFGTAGGTVGVVGPVTNNPLGHDSEKHNETVDAYGQFGSGYGPVT